MPLLTGGNIANIERIKIVTDEAEPKTYVWATLTDAQFDAAVSAGVEKEQRVKNAIMGLIKTEDIVKGYDLQFTDERIIWDIFALLNGGTNTPTGELNTYTGPLAGAQVSRKKFQLFLYTSDRDSDGSAVKYHEWSFPGCKGTPVSGKFTDGDFFRPQYKIASRPATGVATISVTEIEELPAVA